MQLKHNNASPILAGEIVVAGALLALAELAWSAARSWASQERCLIRLRNSEEGPVASALSVRARSLPGACRTQTLPGRFQGVELRGV